MAGKISKIRLALAHIHKAGAGFSLETEILFLAFNEKAFATAIRPN
jgi:hypothetical protein